MSVVVLVAESVTVTCRALTVMLLGVTICSLTIMVVVTVPTVVVNVVLGATGALTVIPLMARFVTTVLPEQTGVAPLQVHWEFACRVVAVMVLPPIAKFRLLTVACDWLELPPPDVDVAMIPVVSLLQALNS